MKTANIFNIQRYSIHDGPGIRTTVFFKGCPLNCWWCHNPESQATTQELLFDQERCLGCGNCLRNCPVGAIELVDGKALRAKSKCDICGQCIQSCPVSAVELVGQIMTVEEVIEETEKDLLFYEESGGGVTCSGGEPLLQADFLTLLADYYQQAEIELAVDTCGQIAWEKLGRLAPKIALFLYDLKFIDSEKHQQYTGVGNQLILANLAKLAAANCRIIARIPLIPGINDHISNIKEIGQFLTELNIKDVNLLPYHRAGVDKYQRLGKEYKLSKCEDLSEERLAQLVGILEKLGLNTKIGG